MHSALCWILSLVLSYPPWGTERSIPDREVPFKIISGFLIEFEGSIGGLSGLKFILDTGATHTIVDRKIANRLGVQLHPKELFGFAGSRILANEGTFPELQYGPVTLKDANLFVAELAEFSTLAEGADAIIGTDLLSLGSFVVDYDNRKLHFQPLERPLSPMEPRDSAMFVKLRVQDHFIELVLDTGMDGLVLFEERLRKEIPHLLIKAEEKDIRIGPQVSATKVALPKIFLGTKEMSTSVLLVKEPKPNVLPGIYGYLGTSALKAHFMEFDITEGHFRWR